jgi:hypothetical protein
VKHLRTIKPVQEEGYILLGNFLGIPGEIALALSLV